MLHILDEVVMNGLREVQHNCFNGINGRVHLRKLLEAYKCFNAERPPEKDTRNGHQHKLHNID